MKSSESFVHIEEIKQMGEGAGEDCFVASSLWNIWSCSASLSQLVELWLSSRAVVPGVV